MTFALSFTDNPFADMMENDVMTDDDLQEIETLFDEEDPIAKEFSKLEADEQNFQWERYCVMVDMGNEHQHRYHTVLQGRYLGR